MKYILDSSIGLMFLESPDGPHSAEDTFRRLENHLPSLMGRKFYGLTKLENDNLTYLACANVEEGESGNIKGLQELTLEKGVYDREKLMIGRKI